MICNNLSLSICLSLSNALIGDLRRESHQQEGDRPLLQAHPHRPGDFRRPHHHRGLHVQVLHQPGTPVKSKPYLNVKISLKVVK